MLNSGKCLSLKNVRAQTAHMTAPSEGSVLPTAALQGQVGLGGPAGPFPFLPPRRLPAPVLVHSQLCGRHSWACSLIFRNGTRAGLGAQIGQALRPCAWALLPILGGPKHPHQPEGSTQATDTRSWTAGETEA